MTPGNGDEELIDMLKEALRDDVPAAPSQNRIDALRAAVDQARISSLGSAGFVDRSDPADGSRPQPPTIAARDSSGDGAVVELDSARRRTVDVRWALASAAAVALVIAGAAAALLNARNHPSQGGEVEYAGPILSDETGAAGELEVVKIGIGRVVSLDTFDLPILPTSEYYEIWFVAPDDTPDSPNRISAGTFHPDDDGRSEVTFAAAVDPVKYPVVEITAEPGDGDPSPTGPVVMRVQIVD